MGLVGPGWALGVGERSRVGGRGENGCGCIQCARHGGGAHLPSGDASDALLCRTAVSGGVVAQHMEHEEGPPPPGRFRRQRRAPAGTASPVRGLQQAGGAAAACGHGDSQWEEGGDPSLGGCDAHLVGASDHGLDRARRVLL